MKFRPDDVHNAALPPYDPNDSKTWPVFRRVPPLEMSKSFQSRTGLMGATEPCQKVTPENIGELPPGSVVRNPDGSRLIHLHDDLWLYCCDHAWCYDRVEMLVQRYLEKGATLCHIP